MPGVHPAVHDWVVHGVTHSEPVDDKVDVLDVAIAHDPRLKVLHDEVGVLRQPADGENDDDGHHHLHHLRDRSVTDTSPTSQLSCIPLDTLQVISHEHVQS